MYIVEEIGFGVIISKTALNFQTIDRPEPYLYPSDVYSGPVGIPPSLFKFGISYKGSPCYRKLFLRLYSKFTDMRVLQKRPTPILSRWQFNIIHHKITLEIMGRY